MYILYFSFKFIGNCKYILVDILINKFGVKIWRIIEIMHYLEFAVSLSKYIQVNAVGTNFMF